MNTLACRALGWTAWLPCLAGACQLTLYPVQFGVYTGSEGRATGEIVVENCPASPIRISLDSGLSGDGHFNFRYLADGKGNRVAYNLYMDAAHNLVWGDGTQGSKVLSGRQGRFMLYGQVPAWQLPSAGEYSDRIVVTLEW